MAVPKCKGDRPLCICPKRERLGWQQNGRVWPIRDQRLTPEPATGHHHVANWLTRLFRSNVESATSVAHSHPESGRPASARAVVDVAPTTAAAPQEPAGAALTSRQVEFLTGFAYPPEPRPLDELSTDDRLFFAGIAKRLHSRRLDLPVLPQAAIQLSQMLRQRERPIADYVALLSEDSSLSVEVLKTVNSGFYSAAVQTLNLHDAVVRLGLGRLQSVLLTAHLRNKVLKGGSFKREAELLLEMSAPMGLLASKLLPSELAGSDVSFMRGMLMHVEHLIILGSITDVSRDHRRIIVPSMQVVHQVVQRFGPDIREAVASTWDLTEILLGSPDEEYFWPTYDGLRRSLIGRWLGMDAPPVPGLDNERLQRLLLDVQARVAART
jgi:HD-like signal output (HDOD) protein